ncbi:hypothetical protein [Chitinophaga tropicalis]|uniref:Uncharacterized protein n=1 Tax=Chitinophaga tropicalis TaxID=2683588 RepID=A0A7K1U5G3_9BACT|nr:hypothetical protein [Chitinophaga tropicalis]MVT09579.1 hypothetical protein [Chitinophaga tropicalis]
MMRPLIYIAIFFSPLIVACGSSPSTHKTADSSIGTTQDTRLSEKIMAIAEALPLIHDSAATFLPSLFSPADSLHVSIDGNYTHFAGKTFALVIENNPQDSVRDVMIWPTPGGFLPVSLQELGTKMDSAWKQQPNGPIAVKEPPPAVTAYYTDHHHRKKKFVVLGPSGLETAEEPGITEINISADLQQ